MENEVKEPEVVDVTDPTEVDEAEELNYNYRMEKYKELVEKRNAEKASIIDEVSKKYPGVRLFSLTLPYNGTFIIKAQEMHDMKFITAEVEKFIESEVLKYGGRDAIEKMEPPQKEKTYRDIDSVTADFSNELLLMRCVLYPYNIKEMINATEPGKGIPIGAASLLLERLVDISGWQDVVVEEI